MGVVRPRSRQPCTLGFVDQSHIDHLHHVMQDYRLDDHAFARNDLDHFLDHQAIESLVDGGAAQSEQCRDRRFVDAFARLELAGDDPMFDLLIGRVTQ